MPLTTSYQNVIPLLQGTMPWVTASGNQLVQLDNTVTLIEYPFYAPETGSIEKIGLVFATVTTPQTVKAGVYATDSNGNSTGSVIGGSATYTPVTNTAVLSTLASTASVTRGTLYTIRVEWNSTQGVLYLADTDYSGAWDNMTNHYRTATSGPTYTIRNAGPLWWAVYTSGYAYHREGGFPFASASQPNFNSASSPDERGCLFNFDAPVRVHGIECGFNPLTTNDSTLDLICYEGTNSLGSVSIPYNHTSRLVTNATCGRPLAAPIDLQAGVDYRFVARPSSATYSWEYREWTFLNAIPVNMLGVYGMKGYTYRTDAGSWTNDLTKVLMIAPILGGIADGKNNRRSRIRTGF